MIVSHRWLLVIGFFVGLRVTHEARGAESRYLAVWVDGSQTAADEVVGWGRSDLQPTLAGRSLYDPENPLRSLVDTTLARPVAAARYIEFRGGDRLPGRVVEFADADEKTGISGHVVVELDGELGFPGIFARTQVRVDPDWIQKIVRYVPADAIMPSQALRVASGVSVSFQELRWRRGGVQVLTDAGVKAFDFDEITLLHAGPWKSWQTWHRQLAVLSPGIDSRLMRLDLADGSRLTTSLERLKPRSAGGDNPDKWFHLLQPVWSIDLLAAAHRKVRARTYFAPHEAPLSAVEPSASRHQGIFSQAWGTARIDANVHGDLLRAAGREFACGFGVHAWHELEFELPASARRFKTKLGLDPCAGSGGCARGRVLLDDETLFESPLLIGTGPAVECRPVALHSGAARLRLVADADAAERPEGADPFDIRDVFNWLEPIVELDPVDLRREIEPYYLSRREGLAGWRVEPGEAGNWRPVNLFDEANRGCPEYRQLLRIDGPVNLTRVVAVEPQNSMAVFTMDCVAQSQARVEISIDGSRILRDSIPSPGSSRLPLQFVVPISKTAGKSAEFRVRLEPVGQSALVDWRGFIVLPVPKDD